MFSGFPVSSMKLVPARTINQVVVIVVLDIDLDKDVDLDELARRVDEGNLTQ